MVYHRAEERVYETLDKGFVERIVTEVYKLGLTHYRIHTLGDFMSHEHVNKWIRIARRCPDCTFYAYTKRVRFTKLAWRVYGQPKNFTIRFSYGGPEDSLINPLEDLHCRVFKDIDALKKARYTSCGNDDHKAANRHLRRLGIVYHGDMGFEKTSFCKQTEE